MLSSMLQRENDKAFPPTPKAGGKKIESRPGSRSRCGPRSAEQGRLFAITGRDTKNKGGLPASVRGKKDAVTVTGKNKLDITSLHLLMQANDAMHESERKKTQNPCA